MKHSVLGAVTSALGAATSALGVATLALGAAFGPVIPALTRSFWWYRRGVTGDIGNCGVGITPQMCNRGLIMEMWVFFPNLSSSNRVTPVSIQGHDISVNLTRSMATFHTPEILYIICRNCYTSQGNPDSSFPYLAWDHCRGDIDDPCGVIADFCWVIADPCSVVAGPCDIVAISEPCSTVGFLLTFSVSLWNDLASSVLVGTIVGIDQLRPIKKHWPCSWKMPVPHHWTWGQQGHSRGTVRGEHKYCGAARSCSEVARKYTDVLPGAMHWHIRSR